MWLGAPQKVTASSQPPTCDPREESEQDPRGKDTRPWEITLFYVQEPRWAISKQRTRSVAVGFPQPVVMVYLQVFSSQGDWLHQARKYNLVKYITQKANVPIKKEPPRPPPQAWKVLQFTKAQMINNGASMIWV